MNRVHVILLVADTHCPSITTVFPKRQTGPSDGFDSESLPLVIAFRQYGLDVKIKTKKKKKPTTTTKNHKNCNDERMS